MTFAVAIVQIAISTISFLLQQNSISVFVENISTLIHHNSFIVVQNTMLLRILLALTLFYRLINAESLELKIGG